MQKRKYFFTVLIIYLLYNCTAPRELYVESGNKKLVRKINNVITNSHLTTNMGIKVVSMKSGKTLYSLNSNHLFTPASTNKLYTTSAALHYLSPQFKFETSVWIDSTYKDSAHVPRLVLVGGGDPDLYPPDLDSIAKRISENIRYIDTLFVDNTLFDDVHFGSGWMWDQGSHWYSAQIDALTFNDNCIDISVAPGKIGAKPIVSLNPVTKYVQIINKAVTVEDTIDFKELKIERRWRESSNVIDISGELMKDADEEIYYRNVENPAIFTGTVFVEILNQLNIKVKTGVIARRKSSVMIPIYTYYSKPLKNSLINFLKTSDNLSGELYVKMIGHVISGQQGSWDNGMLSIKTFLNDEVAIDTTKMRMVDGSGLSRYNLTSPDQLTKLLKYIYNDFLYNSEFINAVPSIGEEGTLKDRMQLIEDKNSIRAKTGTLSGVSCLSGYAFTKSGEPLAFSIMMNGYIGDSEPFKQLQDKICEIMVNSD